MKQVLPQSLLIAVLAASAPVAAQTGSKPADFPTRPVRVIVPFTPGSATDIIARFVTPKLADRWGRPVVIDNRPSAGGIVAEAWGVEASFYAVGAALLLATAALAVAARRQKSEVRRQT